MRNRGQLILGSVLLAMGVIFLLGTLLRIDVGALCFPVALIVIGVWMVIRPKVSGEGTGTEVVLLGDLKRRGVWAVHDEEFWLGVTDTELDLTRAVIPQGETLLRIYSFVSDVDIDLPANVGVSVQVSAFIQDGDLLGRKFDGFVAPAEITSENYQTSEQRVNIEMVAFVSNLKVRQF